jgi:hypothetical protein
LHAARRKVGVLSASIFQQMASDVTRPSVISTDLAATGHDRTDESPRVRNSKLSAFYGLASGSAAEPGKGLAQVSSRTSADDALRYANELIERAPLEQLLVSSAALRTSRDESHRALHGSVRRCYSQLTEAVKAAQDAQEISKGLSNDVHGAITAARSAAENARNVNLKLDSSRSRVDKLEGARKMTLLLKAAHLLQTEIPDHYRELVELCLDPAAAKEKLLIAVMRYSALFPVLKRLAAESAEFEAALRTLVSATSEVRMDMEARMSSGSGHVEGLELLDLVQIRRHLGDTNDELKQAFLRASDLNVSSAVPPTAAIDAASSSPLSLAAYMASFGGRVIVPSLSTICITFIENFVRDQTSAGGDRDQDGTGIADEFTAWLALVIDSNIGIRVRKALTEPLPAMSKFGADNAVLADTSTVEDLTQGVGTPEDARRFADELSALQSSLAVEGSDARDLLRCRLGDVLSALREELHASFVETARKRAVDRLCSRADIILRRDYAGSDADSRVDADVAGLMCLLMSTQEALQGLLNHTAERIPLVVDLGAHVLQSVRDAAKDGGSDVPWRTRCVLCAAVMFNEMGCMRDIYSDADLAGVDFRVIRAQLLQSYSLRLTNDMVEILRHRVSELEQWADARRPSTHADSASTAGRTVAGMLQRGEADVSTILGGKDGMDVAFGERDDMLDEGGISQRLCAAWVSVVRDANLLTAGAVQAIQVDAALLADALQLPGSFHRVVDAALLRCAVPVELLERAELSRRVAEARG